MYKITLTKNFKICSQIFVEKLSLVKLVENKAIKHNLLVPSMSYNCVCFIVNRFLCLL